MGSSRKLGILNKYRESLFLSACTIYIFARILSYSLLSESINPVLFKFVFYICYLGAVLKIGLDLLFKEYRFKEIFFIGIVSIFLFLNTRIIDNNQAFIYWLFIVASRGMDYKKSTKWTAIAHFAALVIVIGSSCLNLLDNIVFGDNRESLGFTYTSAPMNFFFYAVILWLAARGKKISYLEVIGLALAGYWLYTRTVTQNAFILTAVILGVTLLIKLFPKLAAWHKAYGWIAIVIPLLAAGFVIIVSCWYNPSVSWMNTLDQLVHSRLSLGHDGIEKYGIPLFGQYVDWIGATRTHIAAYNYVDSSFVQTLINNGWVFFILMMAGLVRFGKAIADHRDSRLLLVFCAVMIHGTFDPQLIWIMFNSLWLAYSYVQEKTEYQKPVQSRAVKGLQIAIPVIFVSTICVAAFMPSCAKVLNRALHLDKNLTGYSNVLLNAKSEYSAENEVTGDAYLRTWADKTGFGEVTPEDMKFFSQASQRMHPDVSRTTICFTDGTGIEISAGEYENAIYGVTDDYGRITENAKTVQLTEPLGKQIDGITTYLRERDEAGNIIYQYHMDANGKGVADSSGAAGFRRSYDVWHHVLTDQRIGVNNEPVLNGEGFAEVRREYDGENLIRESYFDTEGQPAKRTTTKYSAISKTYENHYCILEQYYDTEGKLTNGMVGYAQVAYKRNSKGNITERRYMDHNGALTETTFGYAGVKLEYDDTDHIIREMYFDADGAPKQMPGGYFGIEQEWEGNTLTVRRYLNENGIPVQRTDGYSKVCWEQGETCTNVRFYDKKNQEIDIAGINLARDVKCDQDGWSDWLIPSYDTVNSCQNIGHTNLGPKADGDVYTSTIEIEFRNVTATEGQRLRFWTQGAQDGRWFTGNVWNGSLINLYEAPENGVYRYTSTVVVSGDMVNISTFNIGFRCDYWKSGMYRVRLVKIEKGAQSSEWSPGI